MGWQRPRVRYADIPPCLRRKFEQIGEDVLVHALGSGVLSDSYKELANLRDDQYRAQIWQWLTEKRAAAPTGI